MTERPTLRAWLGTLDEDQLAVLVGRIQPVTAGARVRDLDELALRLGHPATVSEMVTAAPAPVLEVVEAASALGAAATESALCGLLADGGTDADAHRALVRHWVGEAASMALLWMDGESIRVNPGLDAVLLRPLAIGRPARVVVDELSSDGLVALLRAWHRPAPPRKAERLAAARRMYGDFPALRRIAAGAPGDVLELLEQHVAARLAGAGVVLDGAAPIAEPEDDLYDTSAYRARRGLVQWARSAGLAPERYAYSYDYDVDLPSEVYLALAGPEFRAPFHPVPPRVTRVPAAPEQVDRTSGAAAAQFLGATMAILEAVAREGLPMLKTGGVGVRESTRLAKRLGTDVPTVRLALELAARTGLLVEPGRGRLTTTEEFSSWRRLPPERRALDLVLAWMSPGVTPTLEHDATGAHLPILGDLGVGAGVPVGFVLAQIVGEIPDQAVASAEQVTELIGWAYPVTRTPPGALACTWAEAHLLGVLADGACAPFARALCRADEAAATRLLAELLPGQNGQVLFGSDLTVVIPGNPDPDVVDVLDVLARREGHGVANTWRVGQDSVREALDAGYAIDEMVAALRRIAGRELPQALEYLLRDVARRHGHLVARPATTVITSADEALLTEVVGTRKLRGLGLALIAPTVAVAAAPASTVLADLRAAGYLPVEAGGGGATIVRARRLPGADAPDDGALRTGDGDQDGDGVGG